MDQETKPIRIRPNAFHLALLALVVVGLLSCELPMGLTPSVVNPPAPPAVVTAFPAPTQMIVEEQPPQPTYTDLPTYTPFPTYTPLATFTPIPSVTPAGMIVTPAAPVVFPTPLPYIEPTAITSGCCTLRVRNQNTRRTYWIGTVLPWGGNYIKPGQYVDFKTPGKTWMRVWWCRYRFPQSNLWKNKNAPWYGDNLYDCLHTDVLVDETLQQIGVR